VAFIGTIPVGPTAAFEGAISTMSARYRSTRTKTDLQRSVNPLRRVAAATNRILNPPVVQAAALILMVRKFPDTLERYDAWRAPEER
jgi:hypothetical protein